MQYTNLNTSFRRMACFVALSAAFVLPSSASAEVYRCVNEAGETYFCSDPKDSSQRPLNLPEIKREDFDRRLEKIKQNTKISCANHAGIDCAAGPDKDGSVICLDGFRGARERYNFRCLRAELSLVNAHILPKPATYTYEFREQHFDEPLSIKQFLADTGGTSEPQFSLSASELKLSLRNTKDVPAQNIEFHLRHLENVLWTANKKITIKPYGYHEISVPLRALGPRPLAVLGDLRYFLDCSNCKEEIRGSLDRVRHSSQ